MSVGPDQTAYTEGLNHPSCSGAISAGRMLAAGFGDRAEARIPVIVASGCIACLVVVAVATSAGLIAFASTDFASAICMRSVSPDHLR